MQFANLFSLLTLLASSQASLNPQDLNFEIDDDFNFLDNSDCTSRDPILGDLGSSSLEPESSYPSYSSTSSTISSSYPEQINSSNSTASSSQYDYFKDDFNWLYEHPVSDYNYEDEAVTQAQPPHIMEEPRSSSEIPQIDQISNFNNDYKVVPQTDLTHVELELGINPGPVFDPYSLSGFLTANEQIEWQHVVSAFEKVLNQHIDNKTMLEVLIVLVHEGLNVQVSASMIDMMSTEYGMVKVLQDMIFQYRWSHGLFPYTQSHVEMFKYFTRLLALSDPQTIIGGFKERLQRCLSQTTNVDVKRDIKPIMSNLLHACGGHVFQVALHGDPILESVLFLLEFRMLSYDEKLKSAQQNYDERAKYLVQKLYQQNPTVTNVDWSSVTVEDLHLRLIQELYSIQQANLDRQTSSSSQVMQPHPSVRSFSLNGAPESTKSKKRKRESSNVSSSSSSAPSSTNQSSSFGETLEKRRKRKRMSHSDISPAEAGNLIHERVNGELKVPSPTAVASMRRFLYFFMTRYNIAVPRDRMIRDCPYKNTYLFVTVRMIIKEYIDRQGDLVEDKNSEYVEYAINLVKQPENRDIFEQPTDEEILRYLSAFFTPPKPARSNNGTYSSSSSSITTTSSSTEQMVPSDSNGPSVPGALSLKNNKFLGSRELFESTEIPTFTIKMPSKGSEAPRRKCLITKVNECVARLCPDYTGSKFEGIRRFIYFFITHNKVQVAKNAISRNSLADVQSLRKLFLLVVNQYRLEQGIEMKSRATPSDFLNVAMKVVERPENLEAFRRLTDSQILEYLFKYFNH